MLKQNILDAYAEQLHALEARGQHLHQRLRDLLADAAVKVHEISFRVKCPQSLAQKIARPDKVYEDLGEITDLIGLRVITYFEDAIEQVARLIENHFVIDVERSIDKRVQSDPSSFGYRSLHYVCYNPEGSHQQIDAMPFEIQIRSILQHAWAEIEHDLGYKYPESLPQAVRRRFSRLAGLLEIADEEFVGLRKTMKGYEAEVRRKLLSVDEACELNALSLKTLVEGELVAELDRSLALLIERPLADTIFFPDYLLRMLLDAQLLQPQGVLEALETFRGRLPAFMDRYFRFTHEAWGFDGQSFDGLQKGYSLFLLAHATAFAQEQLDIQRVERMKGFFQRLDYPQNPTEATRVARLFVKIFADWNSLL